MNTDDKEFHMTNVRITEKEINKAAANAARLTKAKTKETGKAETVTIQLTDTGQPGLHCRVSGSTARAAWYAVARDPGHKIKRQTLTRQPKQSIDDLREVARREIAKIKRQPATMPGGDLTYADAIEQYIEVEVPALGDSAKHRAAVAMNLRVAGEEMGISQWPIKKITRDDLLVLIDLHMNAEPPTPTAARTRLIFLRAFCDWCLDPDRQYVDETPFARLPKSRIPKPNEPRDVTIKVSDMINIWKSAYGLREPLRSYLQLWCLLPMRRSEIARLEWSNVDLEARRITLRGDQTKNRVSFRLPLSDEAMAVLVRRQQAAGGAKFVFESARGTGKPIDAFRHFKRQVQAASKTHAWNWHDNRRTISTELNERGHDADCCELLLNHLRPGMQKTYNVSERYEAKARALQEWAKLVTTPDPSDRVVPIRRAAS
jgi:integrase